VMLFISILPSLPLVWPSNWGSGILTLMTAVHPSRTSSPHVGSSSLRYLFLWAYSSEHASEPSKPVRFVPPSMV
jgi:hypothetical protein